MDASENGLMNWVQNIADVTCIYFELITATHNEQQQKKRYDTIFPCTQSHHCISWKKSWHLNAIMAKSQ